MRRYGGELPVTQPGQRGAPPARADGWMPPAIGSPAVKQSESASATLPPYWNGLKPVFDGLSVLALQYPLQVAHVRPHQLQVRVDA